MIWSWVWFPIIHVHAAFDDCVAPGNGNGARGLIDG